MVARRAVRFCGIAILMGIGAQAGEARAASACDRGCLVQQIDAFNAAMLADRSASIALGSGAKVRENAKAIALGDSKWLSIRKILSQGVYADPVTGNVVEHVAAETDAGKAVYIGTRLKIAAGRISEVEINIDDGDKVNLANLVPYDPIFETLVPVERRSSREQLTRIITSYFQGLTDHRPIKADYDTRCDRYHSGNRITHNARNGIENSGDVGCYESNLGPKPWGPATEVRLSVIDPERGIVVGYAVLHYGTSANRMQINEVFKILDGRIRLIDNIGLMQPGLTTSGFER